MSSDFQNKAQELGGKAKEAFGKIIGNEDVENAGKADQTESQAKQKLSEAGDALKKKKDEVLGSLQDEDK
ncbi:MAG TPA: CsbD family protein [Corynebacterium sp.]|nr:CsbD family protein [Corynebacterium sp.]